MRGTWPRSLHQNQTGCRAWAPPATRPAPCRVGVPGRPLTSPGEADGSPHWAQPLKRILVQLLSNVQMLHLRGEGTQLSASSSPNRSHRASEPFSSLTEGHDPSARESAIWYRAMDLLSTQMWGKSSVNIGNWQIFKIPLTEEVRACVTQSQWEKK